MKYIRFLILAFGSFAPSIIFASAQWPNEPTGSTLVLDDPLSQLNANGWTCYCSDVSVVSDPLAPLSGPGVAQYRYATGFQAGISPGNNYHGLPNLKEIYYGFWWKPSNPWQNENMSNVNKITFLMSGDFNLIHTMYGDGTLNQYRLITGLQPKDATVCGSNAHLPGSYGDDPGSRILNGNTSNSSAIALGVWHRIEAYIKHSTSPTSKDGVLRVWLNGKLIISHNAVNFTAKGWYQFEVNPTWGGLNNTKTQTDFYWFDHIRISKPVNAIINDPPSITTAANLPSAVNGKPYLSALQATGGKSPYKWSIISGSLYPGLVLDSVTGIISGTPTSAITKCSFTAKVRDSSVPMQEATKSFYILPNTSSITALNDHGVHHGIRIQAIAGKVLFHFPSRGEYRISVFDMAGKKAFEKTVINSGERRLNVKLKNGTYMARFDDGRKVRAKQFHVLD